MADQKRKYHRISKGDKVPVLIEEALDDVIIVTLKSGNKEFRGILLDCNKRNIPHGVCFSSLPNKPSKSEEPGVNSSGDGQTETDSALNSVSASTQRYTYNNDPQKLTEKVVLVQPKGHVRPVRSKAVRDIRLRPRQTLCSKCKNMIHENGKAGSAKSTSPKPTKLVPNITKPQLSPSRHLNRPVVALKWGLRKRKYQQEEAESEKEKEKEVKKPASSKVNGKTRERPERLTRSSVDSKINQAPEVRLYKLEDVRCDSKITQSVSQNGDSRTVKEESSDETAHAEDEVDSANVKPQNDNSAAVKAQNPKATPVIKISFGDGAVLKIPPRLPGAEIEHVESSSEEKAHEPSVEMTNYVTHKKLKKAMKKSKERVRNRSGDHENRSQSVDEKADKHHRKHKRKHKHRHLSPYESRPLESNSNVIVNDWNGNEDKEIKDSFDKESLEKESLEGDKNVGDWIEQISNEENEDNENTEPVADVKPSRPRLLYTWNNNRGLSRVEASPKEFRFGQDEKKFSPQQARIASPNDRPSPLHEKFSPRPSPLHEKFSPRPSPLHEKFSPRPSPLHEKFSPQCERFSPRYDHFTSQEKFSPLQERFSPRQENCSPQQSRFSPQQSRFSPQQARFSPRQGMFSSQEIFSQGQSRISPQHEAISPPNDRLSPDRFSQEVFSQDVYGQQDKFPQVNQFSSDRYLPARPEPQYSPVRSFSLQDGFAVDDDYPEQGMSLPFEAAQPPMIVGMGPYSPISSASEPAEDQVDLGMGDAMTCNAPIGGMVGGMVNTEPESTVKTMKPLMMKIQTQTVPKCVTESGRQLHVGDIVWGKISGFPWWPGRIISITVTQKDNGVVIAQIAHVTWFGSSTMSHMQCSELFPFLEEFKLRFNKKKRGPYRVAIKQATIAAQSNYNSEPEFDLTDLDDYKSS